MTKIKDKIKNFSEDNKSLIFLLLILLITAQFKEPISIYLGGLEEINISFAILFYIFLGVFLMPTTPLNISYGLIFGVKYATLITIFATLIIMLLHNFLRPFIKIKKSGKNSLINKLRSSKSPLELKVFIVRLNPFIPLPISSSLLKGKKFSEQFKLLIFSAIGTFPSAIILATTGYKIDKLSYSQGLLDFILLALLSIPTIFLFSKKDFIKNYRKKIF